ncbi:MAG: endopeptidase La [Planctomycetota bacterium]
MTHLFDPQPDGIESEDDLDADDENPEEPRDDGNGETLDADETVEVVGQSAAKNHNDTVEIPEHLPVLPIRDAVIFPGTVVPLAISRDRSKRVLDVALTGPHMIAVVAQRSPEVEDPKLEDLYRVGTACIILKILKLSDGTDSIIVHGLRRVGIEAVSQGTDYLEATVHAYADPPETTMEQNALVHSIRQSALRIIELSPNIPDEAAQVLQTIQRPGAIADFLAANLLLAVVYKQELLETFDVTERLRKINLAVAAQLDVVELSHKIQTQVKDQVDKTQREYYLREQMKAIQSELGDTDRQTAAITDLRTKIKIAAMPPGVETEAVRELERMERIPQASPEYSMAHDYVDWLIQLPWSKGTKDNLDLDHAERILDEDHYGLKKVKKRILEFLAVRKLKNDSRGPILCFCGPPGVGKTSLGQSIARAMERNFIRVSLGGIHDESTIRGHRRTYIGSMPGRILREIRRAGSNNPLFMLDEIDKITQDVHGDPMAALLEVLDPAQNSTFSDHYIALPFDLSSVLFITTANYMSAIEPALRDRMEIIELPSYTHYEKRMIAQRHLVPRQLRENGLAPDQVPFTEDVLSLVISDYTREAGVRTLERKIGAICRSRAAAVVRGNPAPSELVEEEIRRILGPKEFESEVAAARAIPGVVTGLAFTPAGGEILFIETSLMPGNGQMRMTGQIGDVMRESAIAATTIVRCNLQRWKISKKIYQTTDLHIHVPAAAIPKDGPSAGVAILASLVSLLTNRAVDPRTGMTGEITLSGRVLPVGGITEKVIAAHRAGLTRVILPARNEPDVGEIQEDIRKQLKFVYISTIDEMFSVVFAARTQRKKAPKLKSPRRSTPPTPIRKKSTNTSPPKPPKKATHAQARKTPRAAARRR